MCRILKLKLHLCKVLNKTVKLHPFWVSRPLLGQNDNYLPMVLTNHVMQQHSVRTALNSTWLLQGELNVCMLFYFSLNYSRKGHKGADFYYLNLSFSGKTSVQELCFYLHSSFSSIQPCVISRCKLIRSTQQDAITGG